MLLFLFLFCWFVGFVILNKAQKDHEYKNTAAMFWSIILAMCITLIVFIGG